MFFKKDKEGNLKEIKTARAAKDAGIDDVSELLIGGLIDGLEDLCKTTEDDLVENTQQVINDKFPMGFKPYNEVWRYEPVDSRYFFKEMLGEAATPLQQETIDIICSKNPFEFTDVNYEEIDAMWGKRSGKDSTIAKGLDYQSYKVCCMVDPQKFLGLGIGSSIDIVNVASTSKQAKNVFFKYFSTFIKLTKDPKTGRNWFATRDFWWDEGKQKFVYMDLRDKDGDIKQDKIEFGRGLTCHSLTSEKFTAEGMNIILAIMDEIGAMRADKVFGTNEKMIGQYDSLSATVRSTSVKNMGKILCISYKYDRNCPMSILVRKNKKDKNKFVRVYSVYQVRTDRPEGELRNQFSSEYAKDPEKAAMMYECKEPRSSGDNLYSNTFVINNAIDTVKKFSANPFRGNRICIDNIYDGANSLLADWFQGEKDEFYTAHIDFAKGRVWDKQDGVGIAIGHTQEMRMSFDKLMVEIYKREYGVDLSEFEGQLRTGVVVDLMAQIVCRPEDKEVYMSDVRRFIIDLAELRKFTFFKVTVDGWMSVEMLQEFNRKGIEAELLSVDKNPAVHHTLKDFIQLGLFKTYDHSIWKREMKELVEINGKVDHPELSVDRFEQEGYEHGSKDIADATAGISFTLSNEMEEGGDLILPE